MLCKIKRRFKQKKKKMTTITSPFSVSKGKKKRACVFFFLKKNRTYARNINKNRLRPEIEIN